MGHDDDSAPAAPAEGDELESSLRDIRAAALSGDLESLRAAVVALESRIRARNGEDTGPNATADEEAEWLGYLEKETDPARRIVLERFNNFRHPWGARTELSSYAPHPDEPGMMAARICEGEARLPWFPPDENVTEADFVAGQKLVSEVVRAFSGGDRTVLDRLELAWAHLTDDALTLRQATRLHADYLRWVTHKITSAREEEAKVDEARRTNAERAHFVEGAMWQSHWLSVNALARYFDQKFAALTREELREKLLSASTETGRGRGRIGAPRIGAELAVRVGAFGATDVAEFAATLGRAATKGARPKK